MSVPYIITAATLTVVLGTDAVAVPRDHVNYDRIIAVLATADADELRALIDVPNAVANFTKGKVSVVGRDLYFDGRVIHNGLARRVLDLLGRGGEALADPLIAFLDRVMENPSRRAVDGLYDWLERSNLPITEDGCIIAWKIVGPDYLSIHAGSYRPDHTPDGRRIDIPRNEVDEDPDRTCSYGLHFCSTTYLPEYGTQEGNRVVVLKIDPKDVVAFPRDYNVAKGRCCGYWVIDEVARDAAPTHFDDTPVVDTRPGFPWVQAGDAGLSSLAGKRIVHWEYAERPYADGHIFNVWFEGNLAGWWYRADGVNVEHKDNPEGCPRLLTQAEVDAQNALACPFDCVDDPDSPYGHYELVEIKPSSGCDSRVEWWVSLRAPGSDCVSDGLWYRADGRHLYDQGQPHRWPRLSKRAVRLAGAERFSDGSVGVDLSDGTSFSVDEKASFLPEGKAQISDDGLEAIWTYAGDAGSGQIKTTLDFLKNLTA